MRTILNGLLKSVMLGALGVSATLVGSAAASTGDDVWLDIDTRQKTLQVKAGSQVIDEFDHIAIGRRGASHDKARGDDKTPLGDYRIGWINERSRFHRFFGFTYPNLQIARRAFDRGLIGGDTLDAIMMAHLRQAVPPQSTPLGGRIGIHGLGSGNETVHELFDWTHGCVALTNRQVDRLAQWVRRGTPVVIR
jgi:murein L,D-transpeptidase YafK